MKIYSQFNFRSKPKIYTPSGSPEYVESHVKFLPDGNMVLEPGKIRNRQAEINSYKASTDVNNLIKRYENGDQLALLRDNTGAYADLSEMPKNIHEAERLSKQIRAVYDSMGSDIKDKYRTVDEFLCAFSTDSNFSDFIHFSQDVVKKRAEKFAKSKDIKSKEVKSDA